VYVSSEIVAYYEVVVKQFWDQFQRRKMSEFWIAVEREGKFWQIEAQKEIGERSFSLSAL
jgi:hypothetical protein